VVVVLAVVDMPEAEVEGPAGVTSVAEEDSVLLDQDSVVVPGTTRVTPMVEAWVSLIPGPGNSVLQLVDQPRLPDRIAR
jgi:hypothetical protein